MAQAIGQYRFAGANACFTDLTDQYKKAYQDVSVSADEGSTSFKDISIIDTNSGDGLARDKDYYLRIKLPLDLNYDMDFNVQLVKTASASDTTKVYQFLRLLSVPRGGESSHVHSVALYETESGEIRAMIPKTYDRAVRSEQDCLYYQASDKSYWIGVAGGGYKLTTHVNDVSLGEVWRNDSSATRFVYVEMIFRPVDSGFSSILLQMKRSAEDYNIQQEFTDENGKQQTSFGRVVPLDNFDFQIYEIKNLVSSMHDGSSLSRIGVWGHSGLMMAVNGEEIRVGSSGYYELDALPIASLGIVARDYTDNFTIDYSYDKG